MQHASLPGWHGPLIAACLVAALASLAALAPPAPAQVPAPPPVAAPPPPIDCSRICGIRPVEDYFAWTDSQGNVLMTWSKDTSAMFDENGDLATSPLLTEEAYAAGAWQVVGERAGPLLAYAATDAGPLTVEAAAAGAQFDRSAANHPVSTGSCDLRAGTFRGYHQERDRRGDRPYFYGSSVSAF